MTDSETHKTQIEKFKEAARALEADDDPELFKRRLGALLKANTKSDNAETKKPRP